MKTYFQTKEDAQAQRKWVLVDATDQVVGRLASKVAAILRGKNKPAHTPHNDDGDFVVVINAEKIRFTGKKLEQKHYYKHSGYTAGIRDDAASDLINDNPTEIIRHAVWGMLPNNSLGRQQMTKLKIFAGSAHNHQAQTPVEIQL
ncbi:MAG: 50S ribosomal protein L13 [Deltaproteobacteria bacterium]|nr:50S ribosomal protein L13 [Deltaproteobacteria bacterium]